MIMDLLLDGYSTVIRGYLWIIDTFMTFDVRFYVIIHNCYHDLHFICPQCHVDLGFTLFEFNCELFQSFFCSNTMLVQ